MGIQRVGLLLVLSRPRDCIWAGDRGLIGGQINDHLLWREEPPNLLGVKGRGALS